MNKCFGSVDNFQITFLIVFNNGGINSIDAKDDIYWLLTPKIITI